MRTFNEFWFHPTPEDDILRRAALDSVARAQGEDFATWPEFTTWDLGPGGTGVSRTLFDLVGSVFEGLHPHVEEMRTKAVTWADIAVEVMPHVDTLVRSTLREATQGLVKRMPPKWVQIFQDNCPDLNEMTLDELKAAYSYAVNILRYYQHGKNPYDHGKEA